LSSGFYYYRYLLANGDVNLANSKCRVISNVKVVHVVPKFYAFVDTLCEGLSFQVGTSIYDQSGVYTDSLISSIGCDSIVTLDLTMVPDQGMTAEIMAEDPGCTGFSDGMISVGGVENGVPPYTYSIGSTDSDMPISLNELAAGTYPIRVEDRYGCRFEEWVSLEDPVPFFIELGPDRQVRLGESVRLEPVANYNIQSLLWSPQPANCGSPCLLQEWYPVNGQQIIALAISVEGCPAQDSVFIGVEKTRDVYFPNAFTPDFDGINDYFTVFGGEPNVQQIERLLVFDRWGSLVFEARDFLPNQETAGWDGTVSGMRAPAGIYTYLAEVRFLDGETEVFGGDVVLLR
jgi:gliding motility-associated-like protein